MDTKITKLYDRTILTADKVLATDKILKSDFSAESFDEANMELALMIAFLQAWVSELRQYRTEVEKLWKEVDESVTSEIPAS